VIFDEAHELEDSPDSTGVAMDSSRISRDVALANRKSRQQGAGQLSDHTNRSRAFFNLFNAPDGRSDSARTSFRENEEAYRTFCATGDAVGTAESLRKKVPLVTRARDARRLEF
jgi:hypothetical protein